jgi:hypothetical protein
VGWKLSTAERSIGSAPMIDSAIQDDDRTTVILYDTQKRKTSIVALDTSKCMGPHQDRPLALKSLDVLAQRLYGFQADSVV